MGRQQAEATEAEHILKVFKKGAKSLGDKGSSRLTRLQSSLGNEGTKGVMNDAKSKRDILLDFVRSRLSQVKLVQQLELKELRDKSEWKQQVGRHKSGFKLPDPTRWRKSAELYKHASQAACSGNLGKAADLLQKAVEEEKNARKHVPKQVQIPSQSPIPEGVPSELAGVSDGEGCPATSAPDIQAAAEEIMRVSESSDAVATPWLLHPHRWWEGEEEDDPENKKKGGGAGGAKQDIKASEPEAEKPAQDEEKEPELEPEKLHSDRARSLNTRPKKKQL
jgi:hypothetical protein